MPAAMSTVIRSFAIAVAIAALLASGGSAGVQAGGPLNVDGGDPGCSDGTGTPYCTIGGAVGDAIPGDTIHVFPGTYPEGVDLSTMSTPGDISVIAVDDNGAPSPSSVSIDPPVGSGFWTEDFFPGKIMIDGFTILGTQAFSGIFLNVGDDVLVTNVTVNESAEDGLVIDGNGNAITVTNSTFNRNGGDGFNPFDTSAPVTVSNVTANENGSGIFGGDGMELNVGGTVDVTDSTANGNMLGQFGGNGIATPTNGAVTITNTTADSNDRDGILTQAALADRAATSGATGPSSVTIVNSSAEFNGDDGFELDSLGTIAVSGSSGLNNPDDGFQLEALGDITITESTSGDNGDNGFELVLDGTLTVDQVTAEGNGDGLNISQAITNVDGATVDNSVILGNTGDGIDHPDVFGAGPYSGHGNIICDNGTGFDSDAPVTVDMEGNWWGHASGPFHPVNNPGGTGDEIEDGTNGAVGTVDFTPWIDTITGTNGQATVGQPKVVTFEVTDAGDTVGFVNGPGDPNGPPVFAAATDNGAVQTSGFLSDGTLEVTLTAATAGTATVSITGPCGLGVSTEGNSVTVDVAAGQSVVWGDDNCSGEADPIDSLLTLRHDAGLDTNTGDCPDLGQEVDVQNASLHPWGDVDCSGEVTPVDSLKLLRYDAGLSVSAEVGCPDIGDEVTIIG